MDGPMRVEEKSENGNHFLALLKAETSRLNGLVNSTERELEELNEVIPEEIRGKMRVAVGKAKMLLRKKFTLFQELCFKNLGIKSDVRYPVTAEDLAGYWDTIVIQILQIYNIFEEVECSRKNNWETMEPMLSQKKMEMKFIDERTAIIEH